MMEPLRRWAEHVIDTTNHSSNDLQQEARQRFGDAGDDEPVLNVLSFGFARGLPRNADLVFDMRYLRNPHWDPRLKPGTGLDPVCRGPVSWPIRPMHDSVAQIEALILTLLPRYRRRGQKLCDDCLWMHADATGRSMSRRVLPKRYARRGMNRLPGPLQHDIPAPQDGLEGRPRPHLPPARKKRYKGLCFHAHR
jgi:UPF0042 nucleotide-binding protein